MQRSDNAPDVVQFPGPENLRVGRQDLFDQGGAGPGHADDEHRQLRFTAQPLAVGQEILVEDSQQPVNHHGMVVGVEFLAPGIQVVAVFEMVEGFFIEPHVIVDFAQGKMQVDAAFVTQARVLQQGLHAHHFFVFGADLRARQVVIGRRMVGVQFQGLVVMRHRLVDAAQVLEDVADVVVDADVVGVAFQYLPIGGQRFLAQPRHFQGIGQGYVGVHVPGAQGDGFAKERQRVAHLFLFDEGDPQVMIGFGEIGIDGQGQAEFGGGFLESFQVAERIAGAQMGFEEFRLEDQSPLEGLERLFRGAGPAMGFAQVAVVLRVAVVDLHRLFDVFDGRREIPFHVMDQAGTMQHRGAHRRFCQ